MIIIKKNDADQVAAEHVKKIGPEVDMAVENILKKKVNHEAEVGTVVGDDLKQKVVPEVGIAVEIIWKANMNQEAAIIVV